MRFYLGLVLGVMLCLASGRAWASPTTRAESSDLVLIVCHSETSADQVASLARAVRDDAEVVYRFQTFPGLILRLRPETSAAVEQRLLGDPVVQSLGRDTEIPVAWTPDDTLFDQQWSLRNLEQSTAGAYAMAHCDIDAPSAWDLFPGPVDKIIAIVDTGVDINHPDLAGNIYANPDEWLNGIDDDGNGRIDDIHGWDFYIGDNDPSHDPNDDTCHGTMVAGIAAAVTNNGIGVTGPAPGAKIMPLRAGTGSGISSISAAQAIDYAVANGAQVINNSWGSPYSDAGIYSAIQAACAAGVVVVNCAHNTIPFEQPNNDEYPIYPANYPFPLNLSVANSRSDDALHATSHYGPTTVDLAAPGHLVTTTRGLNNGGGYAVTSGTSVASPLVAGSVVYILSYFEWIGQPLTSQQAVDRLLNHAETVPALVGLIQGGRRLNLYRAITSPDAVAPSPVTNLAIRSITPNSVTLGWVAPGDDGGAGTLRYYDVRWSTQPITEENFSAQDHLIDQPAPLPANSKQTVTIGDLSSGVNYYFALRASDDWRNRSELSNVVSTVTPTPPIIQLDPTFLVDTLSTGGVTQRSFTIRNLGGYGLDYTITRGANSGWLTPFPAQGTVPVGDSAEIQVTISASGLCTGTLGTLLVNSTDPQTPVATEWIYVNVIPGPEIHADAEILYFPAVPMGSSDSEDLIVTNVGCTNLRVSGVRTTNLAFQVERKGFTLTPGQSRLLRVTFSPPAPEIYIADLIISSDDSHHPQLVVQLRGDGVWGKQLGSAPLALDLRAVPNPSRPGTEFRFNLPRESDARVVVVDAAGRRVREIPGGTQPMGPVGLRWDGRDDQMAEVPSGIYFYRLLIDGQPQNHTQRLVVVR